MGQDYLKQCNNHGVPLEEFKQQFCDRCLTPDCSRSMAGTSKFDQRVATWEQALFTEVPQMDPTDPRFGTIAAQKFTQLRVGPVPEVGQWMDPRDIVEAPAEVDESPAALTITAPKVDESVGPTQKSQEDPIPEAPPTDPDPVGDPHDTDPAPSSESVPPSVFNQPSQFQPMNTPQRRGQMLQGSKTDKPVADPWEPKGQPEGEGEIVKPGTTFRFGG